MATLEHTPLLASVSAGAASVSLHVAAAKQLIFCLPSACSGVHVLTWTPLDARHGDL